MTTLPARVGGRVRVTYLLDSPNFGGAEIHLAHHLDRLPARFETTVVATRPVAGGLAAAARRRGDLRVIRPVGGQWRRLPALVSTLRATRPDIVHVNLVDPRSNRILLVAAALAPGQAVATAHMTGALGRGPSRLLLRLTYQRLDAVITASRPIHDLVTGPLRVPATKVAVVRNGVPPAGATAGRDEPAGDRTAVDDGATLRVGVACRLTDQKGVDLLLDAVRRLVCDGTRVELVIAGDGRRRAELERAAVGLPVRFIGWCDDVPAFLRQLDVFCLPSRAEALPLALLEALMAGLPSVATDVGDVAAAAGDLVEVVPPEDVDALTAALQRVLSDPRRRRDLARRARDAAPARFHVARMVADTVTVYERMLDGVAAVATSR